MSDPIATGHDSGSTSAFTDDELYRLTILPSLAGSVITFSDTSGPIGTVKEMLANAKTAAAGVEDYPDNSIIRSVIPKVEDRDEAMEAAKVLQERQKQEIEAEEITSKEDMRSYALAQAAKVNALLVEKASAVEAAEYRQWVMKVAQATAEAAKEGGFLGIGGETVSADEQRALDEIATALGVGPSDG